MHLSQGNFFNRKRKKKKDKWKNLTLNIPLQESGDFFCKELDSKYLWLGGQYGSHSKDSALWTAEKQHRRANK